MTSSRSSKEAGFTTVEALVSFLILSMILGGTIELLANSVTMTKRSKSLEKDNFIFQQIQAVVVPSLVKDVGLSQSGNETEFEGWNVVVKPVRKQSGDRVSGGAYGNLYHVEISPIDGTTGGSVNSFRLIANPKPNR